MQYFKSLPSTNDYVKEHNQELDNFEAVVTNNQTKGKGRTGHTWESEPNKNVAISLLVKGDKYTEKFNLLSVITGIVVAEYLENLGIPGVQIKWPNDVYVNGKKICGILLEGNLPEYLIIGIGINVNQTNFNELQAISIKNIIGVKIDPNLVATDIIEELKYQIKSLGNDLSDVIDSYNEKDYLLDKTISFVLNGENKSGVARGINLNGSYKVEVGSKVINISTNEVSLVRNN